MSWGAAAVTLILSFVATLGSFQMAAWLLSLVGFSELVGEGLPVRRPSVLVSAAVIAVADALLIGLMVESQYVGALGRIFWAGTLYVWLVYAMAMFGEIDPKTCMGLALTQRGLMSLLSIISAAVLGGSG